MVGWSGGSGEWWGEWGTYFTGTVGWLHDGQCRWGCPLGPLVHPPSCTANAKGGVNAGEGCKELWKGGDIGERWASEGLGYDERRRTGNEEE